MHRKLALPALVAAALTAGGVLVAASPVTAATGGTISVAYENYGTNITLNEMLHTAAKEFATKYPGWTINLEPIAAPKNPYYTKMDLMSSSASTAPDVLYEDTFLVNSDVAAGFLAPIDSYVKSWSGWKEFSPAAQAAAKSANGHIYGVSMGTDTRGIYYNKQLLSKAGVKMPFNPTSSANRFRGTSGEEGRPGCHPHQYLLRDSPRRGDNHAGFRDVPVRD